MNEYRQTPQQCHPPAYPPTTFYPHMTTTTTFTPIRTVVIGAFVVWGIIFVGGWREWTSDIPQKCGTHCSVCQSSRNMGWGTGGCDLCAEGWLNGGRSCFKDVVDLPGVRTAQSLGGGFYMTIIVATQIVGAVVEVFLIARLRKARKLPSAEMIILAIALAIELFRMLIVDIFLLTDYLAPKHYRYFRVPLNASVPIIGGVAGGVVRGVADSSGGPFVDLNTSGPLYFIGTGNDMFNPATCTAFNRSSPLLDYPRDSGFLSAGGHNRFASIGWIVGGEFAMYYFMATVANEGLSAEEVCVCVCVRVCVLRIVFLILCGLLLVCNTNHCSHPFTHPHPLSSHSRTNNSGR